MTPSKKSLGQWLIVPTFCLLSLFAYGADADFVEFKGQWRQGGLLIGYVDPGYKVTAFERELRVSDDGVFVFGLDRDASQQIELKFLSPAGDLIEKNYSVQQREYNIQRIEGVPGRTVTPPPEQIARIRQESALARKARAQDLNREDFLQAFKWPLLGPITGVYGSQRVYNGEPRSPHYGVDVAQPTGTPVIAPASGIVTLVHDEMFYSGGTLIIDHGFGVSSTFIHLSKVLVEEGQEIQQGQRIAEVGATGRVTGPHLDWRMNWFGHRIDPQPLVGPMPEF